MKDDADSELWKLVKAADKISAYIKCIEEEKAGNTEFNSAKKATFALISQLDIPAAQTFIDEFITAYNLDLDELQQKN